MRAVLSQRSVSNTHTPRVLSALSYVSARFYILREKKHTRNPHRRPAQREDGIHKCTVKNVLQIEPDDGVLFHNSSSEASPKAPPLQAPVSVHGRAQEEKAELPMNKTKPSRHRPLGSWQAGKPEQQYTLIVNTISNENKRPEKRKFWFIFLGPLALLSLQRA